MKIIRFNSRWEVENPQRNLISAGSFPEIRYFPGVEGGKHLWFWQRVRSHDAGPGCREDLHPAEMGRGWQIVAGNPQHRCVVPLLFCTKNCKLDAHIQCPAAFPQVRRSREGLCVSTGIPAWPAGPSWAAAPGLGEAKGPSLPARHSPRGAGGSGLGVRGAKPPQPFCRPRSTRGQGFGELLHFKGRGNFHVHVVPWSWAALLLIAGSSQSAGAKPSLRTPRAARGGVCSFDFAFS